MPQTASRRIEQELYAQGYLRIVGIDEVGRGACAGPVVAGAVLFSPQQRPISGVTDSKLLTAARRQQLATIIQAQAEWGIGMASVAEINELGIAPATLLAMQRAVDHLSSIDYVLVDGIIPPPLTQLPAEKVMTIIKGDQLVYSIAAASIIAKVYRDELMTQLHTEHVDYSWEKNKGYGTASHRQAVGKHGASVHHRTLFVRGW